MLRTNFFSLFGLVCIGLFISSFLSQGQAFDSSVDSIRCDNKIVSVGDRASEVRAKCGEPDRVDSWQERRIKRDHNDPFSKRRREYEYSRETIITEKYVTVEEWTYNLGSTKFIRYLIFENGVLQGIHLGDYGD